MTRVTKLLGGSFAAVLGISLIAALIGLFNSDSGTNAAAPTFRASAHVLPIGAADLASARGTVEPILRYLPGDINATNAASAAGPSNPLTALPASLVSALNTTGTIPSPAFDPNAPSIAVSSLQQVDDTMSKTTTGRDIGLLDKLSAYMKIATINVSRAPSTGSVDEYTAAIERAAGDTVQVFPSEARVLGANDKVAFFTNQANWIVTATDHYTVAIKYARGDTDPDLVLGNDNMFSTTVDSGATTAQTGNQLDMVNLTSVADQARFDVASYDNDAGASLGTTYEAWYQTHVDTALSNSAFLVIGLVALFAATFVAMWTSDGFSATNHRAARAFGAG